jgi:hypothetical protein
MNAKSKDTFSIVTSSKDTFNQLLAAVNLIGKQDDVVVMVPYDTSFGAPDGLMLASGEATERGKTRDVAHESNGAGQPTQQSQQSRSLSVARYRTTIHHRMKPENILVNGEPISDQRLKVLKAVQAQYTTGVRASEIIKKHKLPHGTVQNALNWLREHQADHAQGKPLVVAEEDDPRVLHRETSAAQESSAAA